jgi:hypothetical protein
MTTPPMTEPDVMRTIAAERQISSTCSAICQKRHGMLRHCAPDGACVNSSRM